MAMSAFALRRTGEHQAADGRLARRHGIQQRFYFVVEQVAVDDQQDRGVLGHVVEGGQSIAPGRDDLNPGACGQRSAQRLLHDAGPRDERRGHRTAIFGGGFEHLCLQVGPGISHAVPHAGRIAGATSLRTVCVEGCGATGDPLQL
jgi:hypothetical protein